MSNQDYREETKALLRLSLCDNVGPKVLHALLETFESAREVEDAARNDSEALDALDRDVREGLVEGPPQGEVERELDQMREHGVRLVPYFSDDYPPPLKQLGPGKPPLLRMKGTYLERDELAVALVGSRRCTHYGRKQAAKLASSLACRGYTIVSGLARGIDGEAHRAALRSGGRTLAVMGCGLSTIYPEEHTELAMKTSSEGALISELPMDTPVRAGNFPPRNRIISGLSLGVVVVEAADRSGSLITARWAGEQGRGVMAVPGNVDRATSGGCHNLIRDGAVLVEDADDVAEAVESMAEYSEETAEAPEDGAQPPDEDRQREMREASLEDREKRLYDLLGDSPRHIDSLVEEVELPVPVVSSTLLSLEIKGLVEQLDGSRYVAT